jgi:dipeptidase D
MSTDPFSGLEPALLWKHFAAMTRIPRPSGSEGPIADWVAAWARERGFELERGPEGNLAVHVPASEGREGAPTVVLQGHLDMVCERDSDSPYDAESGPVHVVCEGEWLRAEGTTLGADNGVGVAAAMAAAEDDSVKHGPLDLLMTVDEETGLTGAMKLDPSMLRGRIMLNLDSEEDGMVFVGCAGGCDTRTRLSLPRSPAGNGDACLEVSVSGLRGGHSGLDIDKNRINAIHALVRLLQAGAGEGRLRVAAISGGSKRNAIPREARAIVLVPAADRETFAARVEEARAALAEQHAGLDDGLSIGVETTEMPAEAFDAPGSSRLLSLIRAIPSGVLAMSQDIQGLVETSTNLGVVSTEGGTVETVSCTRSSVAPALRNALEGLRSLGSLAGAEVSEHGGYPGWKPDMSSRALTVTRSAHESLFGKEPEVTAIHAGLECGLIGERIPGMDMVSFGPEIRGAHAPGEKVHLPSVERFWRLLGRVLDDLSS